MIDGAVASWKERHRNFVLGFFHGYTEGFIDAVDFVEACHDDHVGYTLLFDDNNIVRFVHIWENHQFSVDWLDEDDVEPLREARDYLGKPVLIHFDYEGEDNE